MKPSITELPITGDKWLKQMFDSQEAKSGGIVRRKKEDVRKVTGEDALKQYVKMHQYTMLENADQYVVFCNSGPIKVVCDGRVVRGN